MSDFRPHLLPTEELRQYAISLQNKTLPVVFTLNHLAHLIGVDFEFLYAVVKRKIDPYQDKRVRKRGAADYRLISVPNDPILEVQRWIAKQILSKVQIHSSATAYGEGLSIQKNAHRHVGCDWLVKTDIKDFFGTIDEKRVFRVFKNLGYTLLLSLEMARICTRVRHSDIYRLSSKSEDWAKLRIDSTTGKAYNFYSSPLLGFLPQGAATSPVLSNIIMYEVDASLSKIANETGCIYSRYADDIVFSGKLFDRGRSEQVLRKISECLWQNGFAPNKKKSRIVPPGAKKIVTGLVVDHTGVHLPKEFKFKIDHYLHVAQKYGVQPEIDPITNEYKFFGIERLEGLLHFARSIDPRWTSRRDILFKNLEIPSIQS